MKMKQIKLIVIAIIANMVSFAQVNNQPVPEINLPNVNGENISLKSLKGKVVILDFWASWCGPCRGTNAELVKLYKKYKAKGVEIYSVSIDEDIVAWKKAIKKQKITWLQVNDPGNWDSKTARAWGIEAIPATFIIDKKGIIRNGNLDGKELIKEIDKLLAE
jgi:peroxiredoxin